MARAVFHPENLPPSVIFGIALIPPVGAGLALFGQPAAIDLALALAVGALFRGVMRLARRRPLLSPIVTSVIAVALIGPGVPPWWAAVVAAVASLFEVGRSLVRRPQLPFSSGLLAYSVVYLAGHGALGQYLAPGRTARAFSEPIRLWHDFFGGGAAPLDPVTLYVGNVAGPVFATSLLAVTIGTAWLWYAGRLDIVALVGVAAGAVVVTITQGWSLPFQLLSGPLLFATAYGFADQKALAGPPLLGGLLGFAAGFAGVGLRTRGYGVETTVLSLAAAQAAVTLLVLIARTFRSGAPRRLMAVAWASQLK